MKNFTRMLGESHRSTPTPAMEDRVYDINNPEDIADCLVDEPEYECYGAQARDLALYSAKQIIAARRSLLAQRETEPQPNATTSTLYVVTTSPSDRFSTRVAS